MKYIFICFAVIIFFASCTNIEANNDPIIGIWQKELTALTNSNDLALDKEEWIFNDAYLGRFHGFLNNKITYKTDFRWSIEGDVYLITYPGTDFEGEYVRMTTDENGTYLENRADNEKAIRIE